MVRTILLTLLLLGCASTDKPILGKQVEAPYGWTDTYCPEHKNEIGCKYPYPSIYSRPPSGGFVVIHFEVHHATTLQ